jgi:hypothetical protein
VIGMDFDFTADASDQEDIYSCFEGVVEGFDDFYAEEDEEEKTP